MNTQQEIAKVSDQNVLTISIQPPRAERKFFDFPKTAKVEDVIRTAVNDPDLKLDAGGTYYLTTPAPDHKVMDPHRPLVSYHLKDQDVLTITADGGGV